MEMTPMPAILTAPREFARAGWSRLLASALSWIETHRHALVSRARRRPKALAVVETSALGERRFVSVIQFERQRFLIGSSPSSITLLARLPNAGSDERETRPFGTDGGDR